MKLEKYTDNKTRNKKIMLISIGTIVLISVSLLLYKTFAVFSENKSFPFMSGQVDYFGNSDVYFLFYKGNEMLNSMPQKGNEENLAFEHGECNKGAGIEWNKDRWAPLVYNLSQTKTECKIYFEEQVGAELGGMQVPLVESGDGLYAVPHDNLEELGQEWNKAEYRYAGVNPDNYVSFNNEIWRIIGLVNVKTNSGIEQRIKIVRQDGINNQKDFGSYAWDRLSGYTDNWTTSKLKDMLNGIYYESEIGECYTGDIGNDSDQATCDFSSGTELPNGLGDTARNMVDKEIIWNIGGWEDSEVTANEFYEKERGLNTCHDYPSEWSTETDVGEKHNGIGLIYPSDYGYAVGGEVRNSCFAKKLSDYSGGNCFANDWLKPNDDLWTISPNSTDGSIVFYVGSSGYVLDISDISFALVVWPTLYLTTSTKIVDGTGSINSPFVLS